MVQFSGAGSVEFKRVLRPSIYGQFVISYLSFAGFDLTKGGGLAEARLCSGVLIWRALLFGSTPDLQAHRRAVRTSPYSYCTSSILRTILSIAPIRTPSRTRSCNDRMLEPLDERRTSSTSHRAPISLEMTLLFLRSLPSIVPRRSMRAFCVLSSFISPPM